MRGGFIQQQDRCGLAQCPREQYTLLFAAGEFAHASIHKGQRAHASQSLTRHIFILAGGLAEKIQIRCASQQNHLPNSKRGRQGYGFWGGGDRSWAVVRRAGGEKGPAPL